MLPLQHCTVTQERCSWELDPSWIGYIASGPEIPASGSPKTCNEWTHDSICPERSVSGTAWTLADKHCEPLCHRAFWSLLFPNFFSPKAKHISYHWEDFLCSSPSWSSMFLFFLCLLSPSLLCFCLCSSTLRSPHSPRRMAVLGEINSPSCSAPCFWWGPELKTWKNVGRSNIFAFPCNIRFTLLLIFSIEMLT